MNDMKIFNHEIFGRIRVLYEDGKPLFCGKDVAEALGYNNQRDAIAKHCRYVAKRDVPHPQAKNKTIEMLFIPEGDVYRLITHSRLPSAQAFESWVFDEVLPQLRRTGSYGNNRYMPPEVKEQLERVSELRDTLREWHSVQAKAEDSHRFWKSYLADAKKQYGESCDFLRKVNEGTVKVQTALEDAIDTLEILGLGRFPPADGLLDDRMLMEMCDHMLQKNGKGVT